MVGYSPQDHKKSDTIKQLSAHTRLFVHLLYIHIFLLSFMRVKIEEKRHTLVQKNILSLNFEWMMAKNCQSEEFWSVLVKGPEESRLRGEYSVGGMSVFYDYNDDDDDNIACRQGANDATVAGWLEKVSTSVQKWRIWCTSTPLPKLQLPGVRAELFSLSLKYGVTELVSLLTVQES